MRTNNLRNSTTREGKLVRLVSTRLHEVLELTLDATLFVSRNHRCRRSAELLYFPSDKKQKHADGS